MNFGDAPETVLETVCSETFRRNPVVSGWIRTLPVADSPFHAIDRGQIPLGTPKRNQALTRNREGFFVVGQICPTRCPTDSEKFCSDSANL